MDAAGDGVAAPGAGLSFLAVDGQIEREVAGVAVGVEKIAQCGAARFDTFPQDFSHLYSIVSPIAAG